MPDPRRILYSSPFVPAEWLEAHGFEPVRLLPEAGLSSDILQGTCPFAADFVRSAMQDGAAAGIVFASTCDQMRRTAELLTRRRRTPIFLMNVPATWQGAAARDLYAAEQHRLARFLVEQGGCWPSPETLVKQMRRHDASRQALRAGPPDIASSASGIVRLALVGSPLRRQDSWIRDLLRELGGYVALDATETGERTLPAAFDPQRLEADPVEELVRAYFDTIPDAFRRPDTHLHDYLRRQIADRHVQGLVLVRPLWCDHWHAQRERLKQCTGLPLIQIDLGDQDYELQRTRTRLETLVSILR
jgi:benzoyl-CoA reductase/2-hydroxyglutaryl-CoA dehydratase subunit BcrC/BadD/HgdB